MTRVTLPYEDVFKIRFWPPTPLPIVSMDNTYVTKEPWFLPSTTDNFHIHLGVIGTLVRVDYDTDILC